MNDKKSNGEKDDSNKLRFDLVRAEWEKGVAEVITYGANKYAANDWLLLENGIDRYYAAARRHLQSLRLGETHDESGLRHSYHAVVSILMMDHFIIEEQLTDEG